MTENSNEVTPVTRTLGQRRRRKALIVVLLTLVGAASGAGVGWRCSEVLYSSEALIEFNGSRGGSSEDSRANFVVFLTNQTALLKSNRIIANALEDEEWKATGLGASLFLIRQLEDEVEASISPNSTYVQVRVLDTNQVVPKAAVNSIVRAHQRLLDDDTRNIDQRATSALLDLRNQRRNEINERKKSMEDLARDWGMMDLSGYVSLATGELIKRDRELMEAKVALSRAEQHAAKSLATTQSSRELESQPTLAVLQERFDDITALRDQQRRDLSLAAGIQQHLEMIKAEIARLTAEYDEASRNYEAAYEKTRQKVCSPSYAEEPAKLAVDNRARNAGLGASIGGAGALILVVLSILSWRWLTPD